MTADQIAGAGSPGPLDMLGWDAARRVEFSPFALQGLVPGRVSLEHNHVYRVLTAQGEVLAETAGRLKHRATSREELPVVGDWVGLSGESSGARRQIRARLARRTKFSRKAAGRETDEQVLAANVDLVFLVFAMDGREHARRVERYLVVAERSGARPVVVLNKADLSDDVAAEVSAAGAAAPGVDVVAASSVTGAGLDVLARYVAFGRTLALIGPSGAGKSSLVNRLIGTDVLPTGEVRDWDARGRHTSVHRQLVVRPAGGVVIDTPGMRELQLWETDAVADAFLDVAALAAGCRFRDCRHGREPGCAVKDAVEHGTLASGRYESYVKLQAEQQEVEKKRTEAARLPAARRAETSQKTRKVPRR